MAKVLVTDDAAFMRMMLGNILRKEGHEVFEAVNGEDMLSKVIDIKPDLVTLDITMPVLDGLTALKYLKEQGNTTPVIMCTAMGQQAMVIDAISKGASDFVVKPFEEARVLDAVSKVLGKR